MAPVNRPSVQSSQAMSDNRPKKKRASLPKVRTGCKTCKKRRVKCDETRPHCKRCIRFGTSCAGYDVPPRSSRSHIDSCLVLDDGPGLSVILHQPRRALFSREEEHRYFDRFCRNAIPLLSGCVDEALWSRIVLQGCESEPSIRHAIVAIGALSTTSLSAASSVPLIEDYSSPTFKPEQFALQQYNKAIRFMRKSLTEGKQSLRSVILACLLTVVFEAYHGNYVAAAQQVQNGVNMIDQLYKKDPSKRRFASSSPDPNILEDELCEVFDRLDINFSTICLPPSPSDLTEALARGNAKLELMPSQFGSLLQGREYLSAIGRQSLLYQRSMTPYLLPRVGAVHVGVYWLVTEKLGDFIGPNAHQMYTDPLVTPSELREQRVLPAPPADVEAVRHRLFLYLQRWKSAFEPLQQQALRDQARSPGAQSYYAMIALRLHYLTSYLAFVYSIFWEKRPIPLEYVKEFREILTIARIQLASNYDNIEAPSPAVSSSGSSSGSSSASSTDSRDSKSEGRFSFESMNIVPLFMVARCCPDMSLRREAVSIMAQSGRKKWAWDSVFVAKVAEWLIDLEEASMGRLYTNPYDSFDLDSTFGGNPPGEPFAITSDQARVDKVEVIYSLQERRGRVRALQVNLPIGERISETYITW